MTMSSFSLDYPLDKRKTPVSNRKRELLNDIQGMFNYLHFQCNLLDEPIDLRYSPEPHELQFLIDS